MARGGKLKRGGAKAKPESKVADVKVEQEGQAAKANGKRGKKPLRFRNKGAAAKKGGEKEVVDFAGLIFMCNTATKKDCFKYHVFGFPEARKDLVERAKKGMKLFLFDIDQKVLYGVYKASSHGGMNLVSEAFQDSERKFPAQIRFRIHKDCAPLEQNEFKSVIKENFFGRNKFKCELSFEQVGKLLQLFRPVDSSGVPKPKPGIGKESRRQSFQKSSTSRGPPPRSDRHARPPLGGHIPQSHVREPLPIDLGLRSKPGYVPAHSVAYPDIGRLEADALYRQRLQVMQLPDARADALERRAYAVDPLVDASLRPLGLSGDLGRRRYIDDLHLEDRSLLVPKGSLHQDLYRDLPYQREVLYGGQDTGYAYSGTLPYKPLTTLPYGYL